MSNEQNIRRLSDLREEALDIIKKYNELAEKENFDTRIGVIDASVSIEDKKYEMACEILEGGEEPSQELIDSMTVNVKDFLDDYDNKPYWSTTFPGINSRNWQPSSLNC